MANTGKQNGTRVSLYLGGTEVAHGTSQDISSTMGTRDTTTKDSGGYEEVGEALLSMEFSMEGYFAEDATYGYWDLLTAQMARTAVTFKYSTEESGDNYITGSAYITDLQRTDPVEETVTFSASFKVTGAWTVGTVV